MLCLARQPFYLRLHRLAPAGIAPAAYARSVRPRHMPMRAAGLIVEPTGQKDFGPCECCGGISRTVWGLVHEGRRSLASYFVQWKVGQVLRHGANFDLILGKWGEGTGSDDRVAVALRFRRTDKGPSFMVVDATVRPTARGDLAGTALVRDQVVGSPWEQEAYDVVDAVWLKDERIREIVADAV